MPARRRADRALRAKAQAVRWSCSRCWSRSDATTCAPTSSPTRCGRNMEADYAYKSFTATLHRLRRTLDDDDALVLRDGRLTLNTRSSGSILGPWSSYSTISMSAWHRWRRHRRTLRRKSSERGARALSGSVPAGRIRAAVLHRVPGQVRARLLRFSPASCAAGRRPARTRSPTEFYLRFIEVDDLCEPLYRQLMLCLQRAGIRRRHGPLTSGCERSFGAPQNDAVARDAGALCGASSRRSSRRGAVGLASRRTRGELAVHRTPQLVEPDLQCRSVAGSRAGEGPTSAGLTSRMRIVNDISDPLCAH